jgi:hypothetical protein
MQYDSCQPQIPRQGARSNLDQGKKEKYNSADLLVGRIIRRIYLFSPPLIDEKCMVLLMAPNSRAVRDDGCRWKKKKFHNMHEVITLGTYFLFLDRTFLLSAGGSSSFFGYVRINVSTMHRLSVVDRCIL